MKHQLLNILIALCALAGTANKAMAETVTYTLNGDTEQTGTVNFRMSVGDSSTPVATTTWAYATATSASVTDNDRGITLSFGTDKTIAFDKEDQSILFLGAKNTLYYPQKGATINAFRAYFDLGGAHARQFVLNFGEDGEAQGITTTNYTNYTNGAGAWYSLDGQRLDAQPTRKGLYIHRGKKVVIP